MTKKVCVDGDIGTGKCYNKKHFDEIGKPLDTTGTITASSKKCKSGGTYICLDKDIITATCGHTGIVHSTSQGIKCEGKDGVIRLGDPFDGDFVGTMTSANSDGTKSG